MKPFLSLLSTQKRNATPIYLQLADQLLALIQKGILPSGFRLISSREMAEQIGVHRKTVVRAYDELLAQGWLESHRGKGTFVATHLPEIKLQSPRASIIPLRDRSKKAGFDYKPTPHLDKTMYTPHAIYHLDDGYPDIRLAPLTDLSRAYRSQLLMGNSLRRLGYGDTKGSEKLRQELAVYLNETRNLKITAENILIVRGTVMGLYLSCSSLVKPGDHIILGKQSWRGAVDNFLQAGAKLHHVNVDAYGLKTEELEKICRRQSIRMLYLTSHHDYPTTVALRADRRMELLQLAEKYDFIIFEDDYDYDFHYENKPLLPLASLDQAGMVLYCGSFTKSIAPAFRVGYLVGPENVITHMAQLRRIIDRQGDTPLENAIAELLNNGIIKRHLRKSHRVYKERRDTFCQLMTAEWGNYVSFNIPDGGMAVWTHFDPAINLLLLAEKALKKGLYFANGMAHVFANQVPTATRLGFASSKIEELEKSIDIVNRLLKKY